MYLTFTCRFVTSCLLPASNLIYVSLWNSEVVIKVVGSGILFSVVVVFILGGTLLARLVMSVILLSISAAFAINATFS